MPLRLPHVCLTTVKVTCELSGDIHAELEAYVAMLKAERGVVMPMPTLIATMVQDYLQHDPDFLRERRQTAAGPRPRPTPASTAPRPSGQASRNGPPNPPAPRAAEGGQP
jgi:hypothetical protein